MQLIQLAPSKAQLAFKARLRKNTMNMQHGQRQTWKNAVGAVNLSRAWMGDLST